MCLYTTVATKKLMLIIYLVLIISLPLMEMYYLYTGRYSAIVGSSIVVAIVALAVTCHVYRQQNSNSHWLIAYLELSSGFLSGIVSIVAAIRYFVKIATGIYETAPLALSYFIEFSFLILGVLLFIQAVYSSQEEICAREKPSAPDSDNELLA